MARSRKTDVLVAAAASASAVRVIRRGFVARYVSRFASYAMRRGMRSSSRGWLYAGAAASAIRLLHTYVGRTEETYSIKLKPGQALEIRETGKRKGRA
ncbi:MAG TPA: hypothetical protein VFZ17_02455 [Acidimicrobiia bacterium]|nr:hypothetical protein [Acidimicrobiia bacterium]